MALSSVLPAVSSNAGRTIQIRYVLVEDQAQCVLDGNYTTQTNLLSIGKCAAQIIGKNFSDFISLKTLEEYTTYPFPVLNFKEK